MSQATATLTYKTFASVSLQRVLVGWFGCVLAKKTNGSG